MKCPNCKKEVSPEFNVCPWCGYKPKKCSKPGDQDLWLPEEARFCPRCGEPLPGDSVEKESMRTIQTGENDDPMEENLEFDVDGIGFTMVYVEGGTFMMGAQSDDVDEDNYNLDACGDESPVHEVTLSDYYIGETPVTQELWEAVMRYGYPLSDSIIGDALRVCPIDNVSWDECQTFIMRLNNKLRNKLPQGCKFQLPTEAQWEFVAREGNESVCGMNDSVYEWCSDWYDCYSSDPQNNPKGPSYGSCRVIRGGIVGQSGRRPSHRGFGPPLRLQPIHRLPSCPSCLIRFGGYTTSTVLSGTAF